jgi:ribonuclease III
MTPRQSTERPAPAQLEQALGWTFRKPQLLGEALTHASYANEHDGAGPDNERLEFLGDAVLNLIAARLLYDRVAGSEGELSLRRSRVVRSDAFAAQAEQLELGRYLLLGAGQRRAKAGESRRLLENAFEALAGAIFLDGGYEAVERCFAPRLGAAIAEATESLDWKSELQELCHRRSLPAPRYTITAVTGPDHARRFGCEVVIGDDVVGTGEGSSKKAAEQQCARAALAKVEQL